MRIFARSNLVWLFRCSRQNRCKPRMLLSSNVRMISSTASVLLRSSKGEDGFGRLAPLLDGVKKDPKPEDLGSTVSDFPKVLEEVAAQGRAKMDAFKFSLEALKVMKEQDDIDDDTLEYCAAIAGSATAGRWYEFCGGENGENDGLLDLMMTHDGIMPDAFTASCAIEAHYRGGEASLGLDLFWDILSFEAPTEDQFGYKNILKKFETQLEFSASEEEKMRIEKKTSVDNQLLLKKTVLLDLESAKNLLKYHNPEHICVYNSAINSCSVLQNISDDERASNVLDILKEMFRNGVRPNEQTNNCFESKSDNNVSQVEAEALLSNIVDVHLDAVDMVSNREYYETKEEINKSEDERISPRWWHSLYKSS